MTDPGAPGKGYEYDNHSEQTLEKLMTWIKKHVLPGHVHWIANEDGKWHVLHLKEKEE